MNVVPLPSARTTNLIGLLGRFTPGLSPLIFASSQFLICPEKIAGHVARDNLSLLTPGKL